MKFKRSILCLFLSGVIILSLFSGCSATDVIYFVYPFNGDIASFDPQVASTADEFLIIENCYEGLIRVNDDGTVQAGVASDWSISDDGKTYTFNLRKGAKWHIEEDGAVQELMGKDFNPDITADDFVFALQRAVEKNTNAPLYSSISNIVNATQVHSGKMKASKLGVKAIDDYTLEITLESADDGFLSTLSTSIAMPCNEEFFNATNGRYGLGIEYSLFNGQFYVSSVLEASYVLKNNSNYVGDYPSTISDLTFNILDEDSDVVKNLDSGYYDAAYITGQQYASLSNDKITAIPYSNTVWAFVLNTDSDALSVKKLRQAVCLSISELDLSEYEYFTKATGFTPASCLIGSDSAVDVIGNIMPSRDADKAISLWREGLEKTQITTADLTVLVSTDMEDIAKEFVQGIQGSIGTITSYGTDGQISFSLKINALDTDEYNEALSSGDYDIALEQLTATSQSTVSFLANLQSNYFSSDSTQEAVEKAQNSKASKLASACKSCEKALLADYIVYPVLFESSYYAQAEGVSNVQFHAGSGRVCFVNATRED